MYGMLSHPEQQQETLQTTEELNKFSRLMAKQVRERNRQDNTWNILSTPGYIEAVGVNNAFKSDSQLNYKLTNKLVDAVSNQS